jgi:hypothetical protein
LTHAKLLTAALASTNDGHSGHETIVHIDYFHDLCDSEWGSEIARHALETLNHKKRNKVNMLPITSDCQKLVAHMKHVSADCREKLQNANTEDISALYRELAEVTLAEIITFNRRRQGEVAKLTVEEYRKKNKVDLTSDVQVGLSDMEKSLCKMFSRVELRGKKGRTVPILLSQETETAIDLLLKLRDVASIRQTNHFVFALSNSDNHLRGSDVLRNAASRCGASKPSTLTSTNFRKHVATLCQIINLKDNELDLLAQFMGHDIRIHRSFYRLPNDVLQTSQLAKVFLLLENGELAEHKGKSLSELMMAVTNDSGDVCEYLVFLLVKNFL